MPYDPGPDVIEVQRGPRMGPAAGTYRAFAATLRGLKMTFGRLVGLTAGALADAGRRLPLFLGLSGSDTRKVVKALERTAAWPIDGYLIACPYYTRPSQEGMVRHFSALAESTARPIMIYNIRRFRIQEAQRRFAVLLRELQEISL